jgi:bifunctional N-acetylglucosamine-1-phosphate-uridyltransferase/glucosamine-1-phosphate-acetyltransferase GlmU-like protein
MRAGRRDRKWRNDPELLRDQRIRIQSGASIQTVAHLRPGTVIKKGARIQEFRGGKEERDRTELWANHLSYLIDAIVGQESTSGRGRLHAIMTGLKSASCNRR